MAQDVIRILSDLHYGDRASCLGTLADLTPLCDGASRLILNGDTLDTRPGPAPDFTAALRAEVSAHFAQHTPPVTFLTGNHDPDFSATHSLDLAGGRVFVTHGDILFDNLVPWGNDATLARQRVLAELVRLDPAARDRLEDRLGAIRRAAFGIPQRHQAERHGLKYAAGFLTDTVWPPLRVLRVLRAWREAPARAARLTLRHRPHARFFIMGHVHRPGAWRTRGGLIVLNTGSFCPPLGTAAVDLTPDRITLRRVERRRGEFRLGATLADFALATA
ncbi:MAG: metallophosphoesterase family protein [Verrucomicrobia bacterium]|nr:metallophosphoesterase family protein [Verrucomicrobiota bacterium]